MISEMVTVNLWTIEKNSPFYEDTVIYTSSTTWKFCKKCVCSVMGKDGFYNYYHTTSDNRARAPKADPPQSQYDGTLTT